MMTRHITPFLILSLLAFIVQPASAPAQTALLEIDADIDGNVLAVRDAAGQPLTAAPFKVLSGLTAKGAKALVLGRAEAAAAGCCWVSGRWYNCREAAAQQGRQWAITIDQAGDVARVDGYEDGQWKQDVQPVPEGGQLANASLHAMKGHTITLVEKNGTTLGILVSPDPAMKDGLKIWYDSQAF